MNKNHADLVIALGIEYFTANLTAPSLVPSIAAVTDAIMLLGNLELAATTDGADWEAELPAILAAQDKRAAEEAETKRMRKLGREHAKPGVSFGRGAW